MTGAGVLMALLLAGGQPAFEVASIRPAAPQQQGKIMISMGGDPSRVNYTNVSLKNVLMRAYEVRTYQIGGPSWIDEDRFDIIAKIPDGATREQVPAMLRNLLAERFRMVVRRETKEQQVYGLVVGRGGAKLTRAEDDGTPAAKGMMMMSSDGRLEARRSTLAAFTDMLSNLLDRPVVDMTGLDGIYDITLEVSMEDLAGMRKLAGGAAVAHAAPAPESAPAASIFTAIQQLGLRLEPRRAPIDFIVVEKAERVPTEN